MATVSGVLRLTVDGKIIYQETDATINFNTDFRERATKDENSIAPNRKTWDASGSGLVVKEVDDDTAEATFEDLFDAWSADTQIDVQFTTSEVGDTFYKGKAYFSNLSMNSNQGEDPSASWSLRGDGVPEKDVVPAS